MAETKHTPGPWTAVKVDPPYSSWKVEATTGGYTGTLCSSEGIGLDEADAHLIAAAPDLYEALKRLVSSPLGEMAAGDLQQAEAAIAKAEGQ